MASPPYASLPPETSFSDFPEDVQLSILSYLRPSDVSSFACTSRHSASLCAQPKFWFCMCERRWGSKTAVSSWAGGGRDVPFSRVYRALERWESLIGFWRRIARGGNDSSPPLVFFEWGRSGILAYRVTPSADAGSYGVRKVPYLWMGLSSHGEPLSFVLGHRYKSSRLTALVRRSGFLDKELVPVIVSVTEQGHLVVEENSSFYPKAIFPEDESSVSGGLLSEIYRYFSSQINSVGEGGAAAGPLGKRERNLFGRRIWESEHFMKIINCYPTPSRPLQGLWKGIRENMSLDFFLVTYDDAGGITCRRVGDSADSYSGYSPVFWTSSMSYMEFPFPREEVNIYSRREHTSALSVSSFSAQGGVVSRIIRICSSYDLVIPSLSGSSADLRNVEGRIWEYEDGSFGFGFLRNDFIIDMKRVAMDGYLLDSMD